MQPIYLDYQASTPIDSRVLDVMMPYLTEKFGNPHSSNHRYGMEGEAALDIARQQVADVLSAKPKEMIFTSGATESNNWVIKSVMARRQSRPHMITLATEHKCVLNSALAAQRSGAEVTILPVDQQGLIDLAQLEAAITDQTGLISIMLVNNEIGTIQPVRQIAELASERGVLVHTDAAQAFGKLPIDINDLPVDFISISGHKIYGPKGVGALWVRAGSEKYLQQFMDGGAQEGGLRAGTQAPALVAGLGKAAALCAADMDADQARIGALTQKLWGALQESLTDLHLNGPDFGDQRWAGNLNISFMGARSDLLLRELRTLALSSGSACASGTAEPSHVLTAIGLSEPLRESTLRISIGRMTTEAEINTAASAISDAVSKIRKSRAW